MKTFTIGREPGCNIELDGEMTSRKHAILKVYPSGKMEIVDISVNGTFVNGMQITANTPFPVTRKDIVIFAHADKLDWSKVPNPKKRFIWIGIGVLATILIILLAIILPNIISTDDSITNLGESSGSKTQTEVKDSTSNKEDKKQGGFEMPVEKKKTPQKQEVKTHSPQPQHNQNNQPKIQDKKETPEQDAHANAVIM